MLRVDDLCVAYGKIQVLHHVGLGVGHGEIVALIGANGAGKSTLINSISGLLKPKQGAILFEDCRVDRLLPEEVVKRGLVQVPEGRELFPALTVLENLQMGSFTIRDKVRMQANLERVYELFPILREKSSSLAQTMSGGEQQMLAIGRAMMSEPKMLMMDEPSFGLAPLMVARIFEIAVRLNQDHGIPILIVEQNVSQSLKIAHRGYVMERGDVTMQGTGQELLNNPHVVKCYMGI
jgi:branched-chain amino acid transport system ATP-binding protein